MANFDAKHHDNFNENNLSLGLTAIPENSENKLLILLKTNPKELEFLFKYLNILSNCKTDENNVDWINYEQIISEHYSCKTVEVANIMIELYKAGKYTELCKDYSVFKGLSTYQRMVSN